MSDELNKNSYLLAESKYMSWTPQELKSWSDAGLVPKELLDPSKQFELASHLIIHKETLYDHYKQPSNENRFQIVPYPSDGDSAYEFHIMDMRGNILKVLEKSANFEISDDIILKIPAKEAEEWKKESVFAKKLTKEQSKDVKVFIDQFAKDRPLTKKEIITIIEEIQKKKTKKIRQSGHFVDQKLHYSKPNQSLTLFDVLSPETKQKIEDSKVEVKVEGIKLTPPEHKLITALNVILHEKSQTNNTKAEDFYSGNAPSQTVIYGNKEQKAVVLKFKPSELYRAYMGKDDYSGADIGFISNTLHELESKKMLIKYDRIKKTRTGKKEETLTDRIEDFQSLIKILVFIPDLTDEEKNRLDMGENSIRQEKAEFIVALNPIFTDQIDTKYMEFPVDTNRRLVIAAGGHSKVTASMNTLMDWMLRELSAKRTKMEVNEENLPYMLNLENYVKQKRKKKLQERIEKDIQAMINLGILLKSEKKANSTGGMKWVFHLNKDYN
jgi:hypothetical protein